MKQQAPDVSQKLYCSFCGKPQDEVALLIAGPTAHICEDCIAGCVNILADKHREKCSLPILKGAS